VRAVFTPLAFISVWQNAMDWLEKLYSPQWQSRFTGRASSLYGHLDDFQTLAEDAASMTAMKLSSYSEADATDALILSVFKNALTDCVRERHGFPRPRKWLEDMGDIGRKLFKLICLKGNSRVQVSEWVQAEADTNGVILGNAPSVEAAQALAVSIFDTMQEAQECAPWRRHMARENTEDEDAVSPFANISSEESLPEDHAAFDQMRHFVESIAGAADIVGASDLDQKRIYALAERTWADLGLDDRDRLVMNAYIGRGIHVDNRRSETSELGIATDLGMSVPQIRHRRKKVLAAMLAVFS